MSLLTLLALVIWALFWLGPRLKLWWIEAPPAPAKRIDDGTSGGKEE